MDGFLSSLLVYMRDVLRWLPVSQRTSLRIAGLVSRCALGCGPSYLLELCRPVADRRRITLRRGVRSSLNGLALLLGSAVLFRCG